MLNWIDLKSIYYSKINHRFFFLKKRSSLAIEVNNRSGLNNFLSEKLVAICNWWGRWAPSVERNWHVPTMSSSRPIGAVQRIKTCRGVCISSRQQILDTSHSIKCWRLNEAFLMSRTDRQSPRRTVNQSGAV